MKKTSHLNNAPQNCFLTVPDGLRLHYLDYPCPSPRRLPLICLPGLARSADDFSRVASEINARGRRVIAIDYRGRGQSDWDQDWRNYSLDTEQSDIFAILAEAEISQAVFLGTSRGGMHIMRICAHSPSLVCAAILNDIGPKIENDGLVRIKRYVGKLPPMNSMSDTIALMRMSMAPSFPGVEWEDWETYARHTFVEKNGKVILRYDPALSHTLDSVTPESEYETFWGEFDFLKKVQLLVIRGETSDIFSTETLEEMKRIAQNLQSLTVMGQGHAPLLLDRATIEKIALFLDDCP